GATHPRLDSARNAGASAHGQDHRQGVASGISVEGSRRAPRQNRGGSRRTPRRSRTERAESADRKRTGRRVLHALQSRLPAEARPGGRPSRDPPAVRGTVRLRGKEARRKRPQARAIDARGNGRTLERSKTGFKIYGLTGGAASGKTTVGKILERRGFPVLDADDLARELSAP